MSYYICAPESNRYVRSISFDNNGFHIKMTGRLGSSMALPSLELAHLLLDLILFFLADQSFLAQMGGVLLVQARI